MKFDSPVSLDSIAKMLGARLKGNKDFPVTGINEIHKVEKGDLTFVDHPKYYSKALASAASVILMNKDPENNSGKEILISDDPFRDFNLLSGKFSPFRVSEKMISDSAVIGEGTIIQPGVFIGNDVQIGKECVIHPHVVLYDGCVIGNNVVIHAGSVLGSDAFYYKKQKSGYSRLLSCGRVIVHDDVEIGSACTIDKGVTSDTVIGQGTKLDNQVHVGHDTVIGKNCIIAAQVGIAGVVTIEDDVILWGQVGIQKDLKIGKGAVVLGQSGIQKDLEAGKTYFGSPSMEAMERMRQLALLKKLPELFEHLKK